MSEPRDQIKFKEGAPMAEPRDLAEKIADDLFTNGIGEQAQRLVLTVDGPPKRDLGGWCREAVIARVRAIIVAEKRQDKRSSTS